MPNSETPPSPQLFFETMTAFQKTGALKAGIDLGLFTAIGDTPATAAEIAARCQCPERGIRILSDSLAILGFLTKEGARYSLTPDSATFLDRNSPAYVGGAATFFTAPAIADAFDTLAETVRNGRVHTSEHGTTAPDHPVWIEFARAMGPMMVPPANGAAALVPLDSARDTRVLDISASHGAYGIAFAKANPRAHLVALDWEAVLAVAEGKCRRRGASRTGSARSSATPSPSISGAITTSCLCRISSTTSTSPTARVSAARPRRAAPGRPGGHRRVRAERGPHHAARRRQLQPRDARHHAGRRRLHLRRISRNAHRRRLSRCGTAPATADRGERRDRYGLSRIPLRAVIAFG
jgi:hypothetical protein